MFRLIFLPVLAMVSLMVFSQSNISSDFIVTNSDPYKVIDAPSKLYFSDNKGFSYSVKSDDGVVTVQKFDVIGMKEVARNVYQDMPAYNKAIDVLHLGNHFYYIYESFNRKADTKSVHAREFISSNCSFGNEITLFTSNGDVANGMPTEGITYWGAKAGPPFTIYKSFDESKILISYRRKPISKRDAVNHDLLGFFVFDSTLKLIWGKEVEMPFTEKVINNLAYTVGSDGTAFMMIYHRDEKNFQFLSIPGEGEVSVQPIDCRDFTFNNLYMKENKEGNIGFLGYYANGIDYSFWDGSKSFNTNGISYFELSKTGEILSTNDIEFPLELINLNVSSRQQNKNESREKADNAGIRDVKLRNFTVNPDGSVFILGEQQYYTVTTNYNASTNSFSSTYKYYYEDIIATKINSKGDVLWMKKLPKRQFGLKGRGGMGIAYLEGENSHYVLFLDNVKNADIAFDEVPAKHFDGKGGYLTAYKIDDASGAYSKHTLYNSVEVNGVRTYQFETTRILEAMDNILLVEVYIKGKKDMMIKMELVESPTF